MYYIDIYSLSVINYIILLRN